jgi:hypothetical protein
MNASRWLDRPPTAEEVRAHAAAHPAEYAHRTEAPGLWLLSYPKTRSAKPSIVALSAGDEEYASRLHALLDGARWLPLTAEGLPVEALRADHAHDEAKARDNEFHRLWTSCVGEPGYVKSEWTVLLREFEAANREGRTRAAVDVLQRARKLAGVER